MSPLIEEARRRQRRRRHALATAALVLSGAAVAVIGLRQPDPRQERTSSGVTDAVRSGPTGIVIGGVSAARRPGPSVVVSPQAAIRTLRRGESITAELRRNPATGKFEVRLTTSH
jgi:hypothetical protein